MNRGLAITGLLFASSAFAGPTAALLEWTPGGEHTDLVFQAVDAATPRAAVARLDHAPGAAVRGSLIPGAQSVAIVADLVSSRDRSFASTLLLVTPGREARVLADRVAYAGRPLVTADGRLFVERGWPGNFPTSPDGKMGMRVDSVALDEIDLATGTPHSLHAYTGYTVFPTGVWKHEVVLYRVGPEGADLIAVDEATRAVRVLASPIPPFARDFWVDGTTSSLLFTERDDNAPIWWAERMDLRSGKRTRLVSSPNMGILPRAWPGGSLAINDRGLAVLGSVGIRQPFGDGTDEVRAISSDGRWILGLHSESGAAPVPFAIRADGSRALQIALPPGSIAEPVGFAGGSLP